MEEPVRFWQGMSKTAVVELLDKIMIGKNADGSTKYTDINKLLPLLASYSTSGFDGIASVDDIVTSPEQPVIKLAEKGNYPNYGVAITGGAGFIVWNGLDWEPVNLDIDVSDKVDSDYIFTQGKNLFNQNDPDFSPNKGVSENTGNLFDTDSYNTTGFIRVNSGDVLFCSSNSSNVPPRFLAYYDSDKLFVSGLDAPDNGFVVPSGVTFMRLSYPLLTVNFQVELNSVTSYEPFITLIKETLLPPVELPDNIVKTESVLDKAITADKVDFITSGKNKFNKDKVTTGFYINEGNGLPASNASYIISGYIEVKVNTLYSISTSSRYPAFYDENGEFISAHAGFTTSFTTPESAKYVRITLYASDNLNVVQLEEGAPTSFEKYYNRLDEGLTSEEFFAITGVEIVLPNVINAIVGDTLQLFFRGMIKAVNPYNYDIVIECDKGRLYPRYFEYSPLISDVGSDTFRIKVKSNLGKVLADKSCTIVTKNAVQSPAMPLKNLIIGDSLTNARIYPFEAYRRLTGTGGSPAGKNFNNISFLGRKQSGAIGVEGNSGWGWADYLTVGRKAYTFAVSGVTTEPVIEAVYSDANGKTYTMWWDYSSTSLKFIVDDLVSTPPTSGTLTKVSGIGDTTINYSSRVQSSANPFWNDSTNQLDVQQYVDKWCGGSIDILTIFLTWNGVIGNQTDFSAFTGYAATFFNHVKALYPSIKIKMLSVQIPDLKQGMGIVASPHENYYTDQYGLTVTAFNMAKAYKEFANNTEFSSFVEFVDVATQFDSEYNMPFSQRAVNIRNSAHTEPVGTNDVHPSTEGYYQIADVLYRNFVANFCQ